MSTDAAELDVVIVDPPAYHGTVRLHEDDGFPDIGATDAAPVHDENVVPRNMYTDREELARGGIGTVSVARDTRLGREVAIKEMLQPYGPGSERFLREAVITARLQHPAIVPVYEAGCWPDGHPFYAMKLVEGRTLEAHLDDTRSLTERLTYLPRLTTVVDAVAYAHSQRIIHRDIKPANIILGDFGETVVVDWGLAKELDVASDEEQGGCSMSPVSDFMTRVGSVVGTPMYMAPEQTLSADVDERADIYSLGVVLYQLISGSHPYTANSASELLVKVRDEAPISLADRVPDAPADLVAIVERAMARDPDERYPCTRDLAADLKRFQNGQLVAVHEYSLWALMKRWMRRYRAALMVAAVLAALLLVSTGVGAWQVLEERDAVRANLELATMRRDQLIVAQSRLESDPTSAIAWLKQLPADADGWDEARNVALAARNQGIATHVWRDHDGPVGLLAVSPDGRYLVSGSEDHGVRIRDLESGVTRVLTRHSYWVRSVALSPSRSLVASVDLNGELHVTSLDGERLHHAVAGGGYEAALRFSADGSYLLEIGDGRPTRHGLDARAIRVHELESGHIRTLDGHRGALRRIELSADGRYLASGDREGEVRLWHLPSGAPGPRLHVGDGPVQALAFSHDGGYLAATGASGLVRMWDPVSGGALATYEHEAVVYKLAFSPREPVLATAAGNGTVRLWDTRSHRQTALGQHHGGSEDIAFSPDGALLGSWGREHDAHIWSVATGQHRRTLAGHKAPVTALVWGPGGQRIYTATDLAGIRAWNLDESSMLKVQIPRGGNTNSLVLSPDERFVAAGFGHGDVVLWELATGEARVVARHSDNVNGLLAFSADSERLVSAAWDGRLMVHDLGADATRIVATHGTGINALALLPSGRQAATVSSDGTVALWDLETGARTSLGSHESSVQDMAASPGGTRLASVAFDGSVRIWHLDAEPEACDAVTVLATPGGGGRTIAFSPDGTRLIAGGESWLRLWSLDTGRVRDLEGHHSRVSQARFSPDGTRVASFAYNDNLALVWDLSTGAMQRHEVRNPVGLVWHPSSERMILSASDARLHTWNLETGEVHPLGRFPAVVDVLALSRDGRSIVLGDRSRTLRVWRDDLPEDTGGLRAWLHRATSAEIDADRPLATGRTGTMDRAAVDTRGRPGTAGDRGRGQGDGMDASTWLTASRRSGLLRK